MSMRTLLKSLVLIVLCHACAEVPDLPGAQDGTSSELEQHEQALALRRCAGPLDLPCGPGQYCNALRPGACPSDELYGVCAPRPQACTREYAPVCGCDGRTYGNKCTAAAAGVAVVHAGECEPSGPFCGGIAGIPCPGSGKCVDDPGDECDPDQGGADCGGLCICPAERSCPVGTRWDDSPEVCACVRGCDFNPCLAALCPTGTQCVARDCAPSCEPIGRETCGSAVCGADEYCCNPLSDRCTPRGLSCTLADEASR